LSRVSSVGNGVSCFIFGGFRGGSLAFLSRLIASRLFAAFLASFNCGLASWTFCIVGFRLAIASSVGGTASGLVFRFTITGVFCPILIFTWPFSPII
jgi:hypothetical protein